MCEQYDLYSKVADVAYDMAEIYMEHSDPEGHTMCSDKGLKLIQDKFENIQDHYKEVVFSQFLVELQEREIAYEPKQFYAKAN